MIRAALGDPCASVGESTQAEKARPALSGAFAREIPHDAGDLANHTPAAWQHTDHATPKGKSARTKSVMVERKTPGTGGPDPRAEVATEENRLGWFRWSAGELDSIGDCGLGLDFQHARARHASRHRDQVRASGASCPRDQRDLGQGFNVLHQGWGSVDAALVG